jgi:universal stress protein A
MASDEKDRYGEKLRQVGRAREDQRAAQRDRELLAKLCRKGDEREATQRQRVKKIFRCILCPIDFKKGSPKALDLAGQIASQIGKELYLLHVCSTVTIPTGGRVEAEKAATHKLEAIALRRLYDIHPQLLVTAGDAAERVIRIQSELGCDLIVMGTHGRSGVAHLLLGSVAERVVRGAARPVLTVR